MSDPNAAASPPVVTPWYSTMGYSEACVAAAHNAPNFMCCPITGEIMQVR